MHPRSLRSFPIRQVTNKGLEMKFKMKNSKSGDNVLSISLLNSGIGYSIKLYGGNSRRGTMLVRNNNLFLELMFFIKMSRLISAPCIEIGSHWESLLCQRSVLETGKKWFLEEKKLFSYLDVLSTHWKERGGKQSARRKVIFSHALLSRTLLSPTIFTFFLGFFWCKK